MNKSQSRIKTENLPASFASEALAMEFWRGHSLADYWEQSRPVRGVKFKLVRRCFRLDSELAAKLQRLATDRGVSVETLVNLWLQEKVS
jgi:hypothetical protein